MKSKLTKQGVRDLGNDTKPRKRQNQYDQRYVRLMNNFNCDHRRMRIYDNGHTICPDCGLEF